MTIKIAILCIFSLQAFGQFAMTRTRVDGDTMTVTFGEPVAFSGQAVTGAAYSAEQVSQHVQTLADGTHIQQPQNSSKMWRDSQGRTRQERTMTFGFQVNQTGDFVVTEITDPVANVAYVIDDTSKIAHRFALSAPPVQKRASMPVTAAATKARPEITSEDLGTRNIEGVIAQGRRTTSTIPIGAQGNDRPMVTTGEYWNSPELRLMVLSTNSDPRNGEFTNRLTNISRAEPDPALFMPPAGYAVVDEKDSVTISVKRK